MSIIIRRKEFEIMCNLVIRKAIEHANVKHWEVASYLGVSDTTFCRWLRKELPKDKQADILNAIKELSKNH